MQLRSLLLQPAPRRLVVPRALGGNEQGLGRHIHSTLNERALSYLNPPPEELPLTYEEIEHGWCSKLTLVPVTCQRNGGAGPRRRWLPCSHQRGEIWKSGPN